jgi:Domain of unknown function DUF29
MVPESLYDSDVLAWSVQQANLLRRLGRGERVNDVDWDNIAEEIESVGRSELHAVESYLDLIITYVLKIHAAPEHESVIHWHNEIRTFQRNARRRFTESMRQNINPASLYDEIVKPTQHTTPVPDANPFTLDDLLSAPVAQLMERLTRS